jgi:hypothetical protein
MKPIENDELYQHLNEFLKGKGIEMKDGSYAQRLQQGCTLLTDTINLAQQGMQKAKTEIDKRLDQMRQVIHEKTAPKPPPVVVSAAPPPTEKSTDPSPTAGAKGPARKKSRAQKKRTRSRKS